MSNATSDIPNSDEGTPMPSVFILGPSLDNVIEPVVVEPDKPAGPGRRQISFDSPPTVPGGQVNLLLLPPLHPDDKLPINVYAFFYAPVSDVPPPETRDPNFFFKSGKPHGFVPITSAGPDGKFAINVPGVTPSLEPYFVQTILEFTS